MPFQLQYKKWNSPSSSTVQSTESNNEANSNGKLTPFSTYEAISPLGSWSPLQSRPARNSNPPFPSPPEGPSEGFPSRTLN